MDDVPTPPHALAVAPCDQAADILEQILFGSPSDRVLRAPSDSDEVVLLAAGALHVERFAIWYELMLEPGQSSNRRLIRCVLACESTIPHSLGLRLQLGSNSHDAAIGYPDLTAEWYLSSQDLCDVRNPRRVAHPISISVIGSLQ